METRLVIAPITAHPNVPSCVIARHPNASRTSRNNNATCLGERATHYGKREQEDRKITTHGKSPRELELKSENAAVILCDDRRNLN